MIELTDEMYGAFEAAAWPEGWSGGDPFLSDGLAAVLAVVERNYRLTKVCTEELVPGLRCVRETYGEPHRGDHEGETSTGSTVKWS